MRQEGVLIVIKQLYWKAKKAPWSVLYQPCQAVGKRLEALKYIIAGRANTGNCPICEKRTLFIERGSWLRDNYLCINCRSIPRFRAIIYVLKMLFPEYRDMTIHESSPGGASSDKIRKECPNYIPTHFFQGIPYGTYKDGIRCESLEEMTFSDNSFDLVVTQDVLEHVLSPAKAFSEIARTLRPGGAHLFTVPYYHREKSFVRAAQASEGITYFAEKEFHGNPIDENGSLVVTEWGIDLPEFIFKYSGLVTIIYLIHNRKIGLDGQFLEVFVSRKLKQ